MLPTVAFTYKHPQQFSVFRNFHSYGRPLINCARMCPSQTAIRQSSTEPATLAPACNHSRSCKSLSVCRLNEEKVVYPPQMPIMKNCLPVGPIKRRPPGSVNVAKKPITSEPLTFTNKVPQGNVSPKYRATAPDNQKRAAVPSAPPALIQR